MEKQIKVRVEQDKWTQVVYPVCEQAQAFCKLTARDVMSLSDLVAIEDLGYKIVIVKQ